MSSKRLAQPIKIRVSSGGYSKTVLAHDFTEAFELFLEAKNPKALGQICEFKTKEWEPEDDTFYADTVGLLTSLGKMEDVSWKKE